MDYTQAERQARKRQRLQLQGGKRMSFDIAPHQYAMLKAMIQEGVAPTLMGVTQKLIEKCEPYRLCSTPLSHEPLRMTKRIGVELHATHVDIMKRIQSMLGDANYSPSRVIQKIIEENAKNVLTS